MNSLSTSENAKPTPAKSDRPHYIIRKSGSCVKRPYQPRRKLDIIPMPFDKELEEITNEPLPKFEFFDDESEDSSRSDSVAKINEERGTTTKQDKKSEEVNYEQVNPTEKATHDSFDLAFEMLSLETPVKALQSSQNQEKSKILPTPGRADIQHTLPRNTLAPKTDYQFVTPKYNKILNNPKIQCSVNVKASLLTGSVERKRLLQRSTQKPKTPVPLASEKRQSNKKVLQERLPENKVQCSILPAKNLFESNPLFQRITVNGVKYIILKLLGKGGSSQVYHCYDLATNSNRAIKCVSLSNPDSANGYINEVKMLHTLQKCDKIIKMYDYEIRESEKSLLVVLEMGGADLARILKEFATNTSHVPLYVLLFYWMEMLYAVKQIHAHGIIHSDLKPANFLKAEGGLKLIDFGIATCIQSDMTSVFKTVPEGSFNYISPEAIVNETNAPGGNSSKPAYKISYKSDVWSLGCILYQLVYRKTPFQHITNMWKKLAVVGDPHHVIEYPDADWAPTRVIDTIKKCLQFEMRARPSVDELIAEYETIFNNL